MFLIFQIFDASLNDWRVLDEKTHTDVIERIVETPKKTIYVDEFVEIEKNVEITEDSENITNERTNTSKRNDIITNIYDEVDDVTNENLTSSDSRIVRHTIIYLRMNNVFKIFIF